MMVESQISQERQERARLAAELENERSKNFEAERLRADAVARFNLIKTNHQTEITELQDRFKVEMAQKLDEERKIWEDNHLREMRELRMEKERLRVDIAASSPFRDANVLSSRASAGDLNDGKRTSPPSADTGLSSSLKSPVDSLTASGGLSAAALEKYQSMLRQKEGQISSLQAQLDAAMRMRDEVGEELVKLTAENDDLKRTVESLQQCQKELEELHGRHGAALELLGERTEEVEELTHDLADVKSMFKEQVQELLNRIETLSRAAAQ